MKKIIMLSLVLVTILISLGGCYWPGPWHEGHGGHERDHHDRYDHDRDGGHYERR